MKPTPFILIVPIIFLGLLATILTGNTFLGFLVVFALAYRIFHVRLLAMALYVWKTLCLSPMPLRFLFGASVMVASRKLYAYDLATGLFILLVSAYMVPHLVHASYRRAR